MGGFQLARQTFQMPQTEQPNLLEQMARMQQIKGQQQGQQIQQQEIQQNDMNINSQKAMMRAYSDAQGDPDKTWQLAAKYGATPADVFKLRQMGVETQKSNLQLLQEKGARAVQEADLMKGAHEAVDKAPPEQRPVVYQQQLQALSDAGIDVSKVPPQYPGDEAFKVMGVGVQSHAKQMTELAQQAEISKNTAQAGQATAETQAIPQKAAETARHNKVEEGQGGQRLKLEGARLFEEKRHNQATEGSLTSDALTMAAEQYAKTGVMPSVGRTAGMRSQIMNEAARVYPQIDVATNAAAYKANEESLKKLTGQRDSVVAFENTAGKNLDLFLQTAKKVVDFGSPLVNKPMRDAARLAGSADQAAYNAARQVATNEIAKVTSNPTLAGSLSDSARHEVDAYNPGSATLAQTFKVAQILRQDMANRHQSYDDQINDIQKRIGAKPGQTQPQSTSPAKTSGMPAGATHTGVGSVDKKKHYLDAQGNDLGVAE